MKLKNIVLFDKGFITAFNYLHKEDIPMRVSYPVKKILSVLIEEEKQFEEFRKGLIQKYGAPIYEKVKNNDGVFVDTVVGNDVSKSTEENKSKFNQEFIELLEQEFDIPLDKKIEIDINNKDFEHIKLSSEKIAKLEQVIEFKF